MTAEQWDLSRDGIEMMDGLRWGPSRSERKFRLLAAGLVRSKDGWDRADPTVAELVQAVEDVADSVSTVEAFTEVAKRLWDLSWHNTLRRIDEWPPTMTVSGAFRYHPDGYDSTYFLVNSWGVRCHVPCPFIRDIFGNPFRPVAFDPRWRSESAVALARTAYDTRNFTLLPILADALEEAGCDHADVLTHCRDPNGVHVRGCWVVDGVLGKV